MPGIDADALLSEVIRGDREKLPDLGAYFSDSFLRDLAELLEKRSRDFDRWHALVQGLDDGGLTESTIASLERMLPLAQGLQAVVAAAVGQKIADLRLKQGRNDEAAIFYGKAYRLNPNLEEAGRRFSELRSTLGYSTEKPWRIVSALTTPLDFRELNAIQYFPHLENDVSRNSAAKNRFLGATAPIYRFGIPMDCSFAILSNNRIVALVECDVLGHRSLGCRESAIVIAYNENAPESDQIEASRIAFRTLLETAKFVGTHEVIIEEERLPVLTPISIFAGQCQSKGEPVDRLTIDLEKSKDEIYSGLRKTHRKNIRWGRENQALTWWSGQNDNFLKVFTRLSRCADRIPLFKSDEELSSYVGSGNADFLLVERNGEPMAAYIVSYERDTAHFIAGISVGGDGIPEMHWPYYAAILRAKDRGSKYFDIGYVFPRGLHIGAHAEQAEKFKKIASFKYGFTKRRDEKNWYVCTIWPACIVGRREAKGSSVNARREGCP